MIYIENMRWIFKYLLLIFSVCKERRIYEKILFVLILTYPLQEKRLLDLVTQYESRR
jgi:hypothetical protein